MINQQNIAGAVVLYNSDFNVLNNIDTYINQVQKLYVIDNSTDINDKIIEALKSNSKIKYHSFHKNKGIATALNWCAREAIRDGFRVLLTMDDDTRTPSNMISVMVNFWNQYPYPIGILSGVHHHKPATVPHKRLFYTLTSGNLLNLDAYQKIGGFKDDLFIDHVDHEYGFRLNNNGYHVVELQNLHLDHKLGYSQQIKLGSIVLRKYGTNSPIRLYYYARNGLYVSRSQFAEHPEFGWMYTKEMIRRWIKTLLFDENRKVRVKMLAKGMFDGWNGRLGEYGSK